MTKVVALNLIQRTNEETGERERLKAGTVFVSGGDELETLRELKAVRDAKPSDEALAVERGLAPIVRKQRFRSRREIRAIHDAETDAAERRDALAERKASKGKAAAGDDKRKKLV